MVEIQVSYKDGLRCEAKHGPSATSMHTDAPVDNMGKGESFSPTDLVATALATCALTTMGIVAKRNGIAFPQATARITKEMVSTPLRRVGRLKLDIDVPAKLSPEERNKLEQAALTCPVKQSLHPDVDAPMTFHWAE